jgi:oligopeptide/dipeptide ABC transporter ATP-binding protein
MADDEEVLLHIRDLSLQFETYVGTVQALDGVELKIRRDETLGLVGESGCGKSVTAMSVLRLNPAPPARYTKGEIVFTPPGAEPIDLLKLTQRQMQGVRGNDVSMIFQEPMTSLNPVMRVGDQIGEAVLRHQDLGLEPATPMERILEERRYIITPKLRERRRRARRIAVEMLQKTGIADPEEMVERYPHELSGGMRQRIMIAMALACRPWLLIADEPTTALDVTIQAQIMDLMRKLKHEEQASILLITHHLGIVAEMCDRVAIMYAGSIVETAPTTQLFRGPHHPYTIGLLRSIPSVEGRRGDLPVIPGNVPDLISPPAGCRFHPRCPFAMEICHVQRPPMVKVGDDHHVACHVWDGTHEIPDDLRAAAQRGATSAPAHAAREGPADPGKVDA